VITVRIGDSERELSSVNESWIIEQISKRKKDEVAVWVQVIIEESPYLNMILSTPGCPRGRGSARPPNPREQEIFDLWDKHRLNTNDFSGGSLISFLKQIRRKI